MADTTTPAVGSPKIAFKEPDFENPRNRRLSNQSSQSAAIGSESDDEHYQDWTITTDEKNSWANRERRRSSLWSKHDSYPSTVKAITSSSPPGERHGSILSLWSHGKDKKGKDVLHSGDPVHEWSGQDDSGTPIRKKSRGMDRRGSILSVFEKGKDAKGRDVIVSG